MRKILFLINLAFISFKVSFSVFKAWEYLKKISAENLQKFWVILMTQYIF